MTKKVLAILLTVCFCLFAAVVSGANDGVIAQGGDPYVATSDQPTADEPTVDEPTADEPTVDEPTVDEPTVDEPTADEPTPDQPQKCCFLKKVCNCLRNFLYRVLQFLHLTCIFKVSAA